MALFTKLLPVAPMLLALLFVLTTRATPWPATSKPTTHRTHYLGADGSLKLEAFHPKSTFEVSFHFVVPLA